MSDKPTKKQVGLAVCTTPGLPSEAPTVLSYLYAQGRQSWDGKVGSGGLQVPQTLQLAFAVVEKMFLHGSVPTSACWPGMETWKAETQPAVLCHPQAHSTLEPTDYCRDLVRKHDYEAFLTSQLYPRQYQPGYYALRAFYVCTSSLIYRSMSSLMQD